MVERRRNGTTGSFDFDILHAARSVVFLLDTLTAEREVHRKELDRLRGDRPLPSMHISAMLSDAITETAKDISNMDHFEDQQDAILSALQDLVTSAISIHDQAYAIPNDPATDAAA